MGEWRCFCFDFQGFKNQKSWYTFFRPTNNTFVHMILQLTFQVPQIVIHTRVCTYYKDRNILEQRVNLRSTPLAINPEPSLGIQTDFYRERNNRYFWTYHLVIFSSGSGKKREELSSSQVLNNKLNKYLFLSIYKNIMFPFFNGK